MGENPIELLFSALGDLAGESPTAGQSGAYEWCQTSFRISQKAFVTQFEQVTQMLDGLQRTLQASIDIPALGYFRERQLTQERLEGLRQSLDRIHADVAMQGAAVLQQAQTRFEHRAAETSSPIPDSGLLDAWIDSAEEAHSHYAHSDRYAQLFGRLCGVYSELKIEHGRMAAVFAHYFDLPTRSEIDSLHRDMRLLKAAFERSTESTPDGIDDGPRSRPLP